MKRYFIDSSVWIEWYSQGKLSETCERAIEEADEIYCSALVVYEVYKKIKNSVDENEAVLVTAALQKRKMIELTTEVALNAADLSLEYSLGMADALVLASAAQAQAVLITLDNDFASLPGAKVLR